LALGFGFAAVLAGFDGGAGFFFGAVDMIESFWFYNLKVKLFFIELNFI